MAVSGFGLSGVRMKRLDCGSTMPKLIALRPCHGLRTSKTFRFHGLAVSGGSDKPLVVCGSLVSEAIPKNAEVEDNSKNYISSDDALLVTEMTTTTTKLQDTEATTTNTTTTTTMPIPNADEVESFLMMLCDTTSIAEVELKCGGFRLYVARNLADQNAPPQLPAPDASQSIVETPDANGSAVSTSLALSKPIPSSSGVETLLDKASDEGLAILKTPRVGYFRRSRTIKGKRTPPSCKEKDIVKEGQVLCYIDQLGGEIPIESDVSGEVVKILRDDGDPVGYGDALIAVLPSFPGIKHIQ